jgi:hypothetical protein
MDYTSSTWTRDPPVRNVPPWEFAVQIGDVSLLDQSLSKACEDAELEAVAQRRWSIAEAQCLCSTTTMLSWRGTASAGSKCLAARLMGSGLPRGPRASTSMAFDNRDLVLLFHHLNQRQHCQHGSVAIGEASMVSPADSVALSQKTLTSATNSRP